MAVSRVVFQHPNSNREQGMSLCFNEGLQGIRKEKWIFRNRNRSMPLVSVGEIRVISGFLLFQQVMSQLGHVFPSGRCSHGAT